MAATPDRPLEVLHVTRGRVRTDGAKSYRTRDLGVEFVTPAIDIGEMVFQRAEPLPALTLSMKEVIDFLVETGKRLDLDTNPALAAACRNTGKINHLSTDVVEASYRGLGRFFQRDLLEFEVEQSLGADVDDWHSVRRPTGSTMSVRPFPIRILHFLAGNAPGLAALTIVRASLSRGAHVLKLPSNDLFTAPAIIQTMADIDPNHPLVRSYSCAYWRGGDPEVENALFRSKYFDSVVAWGGESAMRSVRDRLGTGIDLIALNPKVSISLIGREAFVDDESLDGAARAAASDVGHQEACQDSRIQFVEGTVADADRYCHQLLGHLRQDTMVLGGRPTPVDITSLLEQMADKGTPHRVWGDFDGSGLVIRTESPIAAYPVGRTVNVVPVADLAESARHIDTSTQTVGVFPPQRRATMRDVVCSAGAQRVVALGQGIGKEPPHGRPHDGYVVLHRMVRWVVDEDPVG